MVPESFDGSAGHLCAGKDNWMHTTRFWVE